MEESINQNKFNQKKRRNIWSKMDGKEEHHELGGEEEEEEMRNG